MIRFGLSIELNVAFLSCNLFQVLELEEASEPVTTETDNVDQSPMPWHLLFEDQRKQVVMLWHLCHVSIVHRTQFYLLFKGDPADQIYMEVELRRLTWLEQHFAELGNASPALLGDDPAGSVSSRYFSCLNLLVMFLLFQSIFKKLSRVNY